MNAFNPAVASNITVTVQQQLLNGFGTLPNTRFIAEAKNERQAADEYFAQQVITTITAVATAYWEYVFARENVKVEEAGAGDLDETLQRQQAPARNRHDGAARCAYSGI